MIDSVIDFFVGLIQLSLFIIVIIGVIAFLGYNKLRGLSELIRERWSNIGVVGRKQASLTNQLIDIVKSYQESEKLVMLKVSEDMTTASNIAQVFQQSGMVLSGANSLAEKFPELKANQQYQLLIQSIKECENELESARTNYNSSVRSYNTSRSSIPTIFYAPILGFKVAPYLEFEGNDLSMDIQTLNTFSSDVDGERLNELLGKAGGKLREASEQTFEAGKVAARKVVEGGKIIAEKAQDKIEEIRTESQNENTLDKNTLCSKCGVKISVGDVYCPKCGNIIDI